MCGIVGYIGSKKAEPILIDGLLRLEYRGYDSVGIATLENNKINLVKSKGRVNSLAENEEAQKLIGYLPEHNPLYLDLYVKEYLNFTAKIYNLGSERADRVDEMIEKCGLKAEFKKKIGQLSKGYRQRVGLAASMIHNPQVLILDEPTTGLDPNQLVEIRELIKDFGKDRTVLFSTHIMQEVSAICDRFLVLKKGVLVADRPTNKITTEELEELFRELTH